MRFQPSELAKFAIVLYLANFFDKYHNERDLEERTVFPPVVMMVVFSVLIFCENDFSTGVFFILLCLLLFFISNVKMLWFAPMSLLILFALVMLVLSKSYRVERVMGFIQPESYSQGVNYQTNASLRAISMGGFWGQGIGIGLAKLKSIPEVQSDYIFAGWAEAMGFVGVILYFALLCAFA